MKGILPDVYSGLALRLQSSISRRLAERSKQ